MDALYLNAAEIYHAAVEESGLSAYSDPALEERFHYLTGLFNAFGKIQASNYPTAVDKMKSTVIMRLKVARAWKEQHEDRKSGVRGRGVSGRVDTGVRRIRNKKQQ